MRIALLGAGNVGQALAPAWIRIGHDVVFGVRDPGSDATAAALAATPRAAASTVAKAVDGAEVVVLATPWRATEEVLRAAGPLAGKVVIDCTNPLAPDLSGLDIGHSHSGAEQVAAWAPGATVFKAFNHTGAANMASPGSYATRPVMFFCGDGDAHRDRPQRHVETKVHEAEDAAEQHDHPQIGDRHAPPPGPPDRTEDQGGEPEPQRDGALRADQEAASAR